MTKISATSGISKKMKVLDKTCISCRDKQENDDTCIGHLSVLAGGTITCKWSQLLVKHTNKTTINCVRCT